jgi:membrane protein required for beta-lactamase induction
VLTFLAAIALLLFCTGPGDLAREIESYTSNYLDTEGDQPAPDMANFLNNVNTNDADPDRPYMRAIALEANDRLFAPMFWFSILGPVGALLFCMSRGLQQSKDLPDAEAHSTERLYDVLIWIPARLLGFGLGLAGTLGPVMRTLREHDYGLSRSAALLGDVLIAALDRHEYDAPDGGDDHVASINAAFSLVKSGFVVWLVVLALLAAAGIA